MPSIQKIRTASERCSTIVRTFLAMARQQPPRQTAVELNALVQDCLGLLDDQLATAGVAVNTHLEVDLPKTQADPDQLKQVITNLIINAQQALAENATANREVTITSRALQSTSSDLTLELSIEDNGPGVPPTVRNRIFEPFFTTKSAEGNGVGLSLSQGLIANHQGSLTHEDRAQGGAVFVIRLPVVRAEPEEEETRGADQDQNISLGAEVLVIDDEPEVAELVCDILASRGYATKACTSSLHALDLLKSERFKAIISDMRMPGLDGEGLYHAVLEARPDMVERIAFITGDALSSHTRDFLLRSKRPYVEKPLDPKELVRMVAHVTG